MSLRELEEKCKKGVGCFGNPTSEVVCICCRSNNPEIARACTDVSITDVLFVYHKRQTDFWTVAKAFKRSDFELVAAAVGGFHLEEAYVMTNSFENPWWDNNDLHVVKTKTRSTSVGDVISRGGLNRPTKYYAVDRVGFTLIGEA